MTGRADVCHIAIAAIRDCALPLTSFLSGFPFLFLNLRCQPFIILRREPTRLAMKITHSPAATQLSRGMNSDSASASGTRAGIAGQRTICPRSAKSGEFQSAQFDLLRIHPPDAPSDEGDRTNDAGSRSFTIGAGVVSGTPPDSTISCPNASP